MKNPVFLALLFLNAPVFAQSLCIEQALVFNGASFHYEEKTKYAQKNGYNELNFGVGYKCISQKTNRLVQEVEIGYLKNSYREDSYFLAYNALFPIAKSFSLGVKFGAASGYERLGAKNGIRFGLGPVIQYKITDTLATNLLITDNYVFLNFQKTF